MPRVNPSVVTMSVVTALVASTACCGKQKPAETKPKAIAAKVESAQAQSLVERPHVTIVALSDWQSTLKPCGCTEELQRGGIERNAHFLSELRSRDDSVIVVHAGSLLAEDEPPAPQQLAQRRERMTTFSSLIGSLDVAAIALSSDDIKRGGEHAKKLHAQGKWPLLSGSYNAGIQRAVRSRMVATASGVKVGLLAVDPADGADVNKRAAQVSATAAQLGKDGAVVVVALSNLGMRDSRRLARSAKGLDVIVIGDVPARSEPVEELDPDDSVLILQAPQHGAYMALLTLVPGAGESWHDVSAFLPGAATRIAARLQAIDDDIQRFRKGARKTVAMQRALPFFERQRRDLGKRLTAAKSAGSRALPTGKLAGYASIGLPWSAPVEPRVKAEVMAYNERIAKVNAQLAKDPLPLAKGGAGYVGAEVCFACHSETKPFVAADLHSHAWKTLQKAQKTRDLDCVPCHSTGFGKPGGSAFGNIKSFTSVQCEACHGPGGLHVANPEGGAKSLLINSPGPDVCGQCHTPEHAPRFHFPSYRKRLIVPGHGLAAPSEK